MPIQHVLPGESGGDTSWFSRQSPFEQKAILRQVAWKQKQWPGLENGRHSKFREHSYPHILPAGRELDNYYPGFANEITDYLREEKIAQHTETLNLKSSQAACFNFLFPLRQEPALARHVLSPFIPGMQTATGIEFEFTGPPDATTWLGEPPGGMRGQNRTSIDAAVFWKDSHERECCTLIEWKYTERSYGGCAAFAGGSAQVKARCQAMNAGVENRPGQFCDLCSGGRSRNRRYWDHLSQAGIRLRAFESVAGCPFQGPFYQLMRQFLLAAYLRERMGLTYVEVVSVDFKDNRELRKVPAQLLPLLGGQPGDVLDAWNHGLNGVPPARHIHAEDLFAAIAAEDRADPAWKTYLQQRYIGAELG